MTTTYEQDVNSGIKARAASLLDGLAKHLGGMIDLASLPTAFNPLHGQSLASVAEDLGQFAGSRESHCVHICRFEPGSDDTADRFRSFMGLGVRVEASEDASGLQLLGERYTNPNGPEILEFPVSDDKNETYIASVGERIGSVALGHVGVVVIVTLGIHEQVTLLTVPPVDRR